MQPPATHGDFARNLGIDVDGMEAWEVGLPAECHFVAGGTGHPLGGVMGPTGPRSLVAPTTKRLGGGCCGGVGHSHGGGRGGRMVLDGREEPRR